ncbi:hypothetical protein [Nonlabens xiamenensis]|uniref:hypothetical protein n=1 Tax=Nonlabens xiamenensis TaxID=2341043 RepID=UPI000F60FA4C|nr:hypothetical protein [Nonlabens xiamenensis]
MNVFICEGQTDCLELKLVDQQNNTDLSDFYIKIHKKEVATIQYDHQKGSICIPQELYNQADSIIIHKSFEKFKLPFQHDFLKPFPIDTRGRLDEIVVSSKKQVLTIGPTKAKRIPYTMHSGGATGTLFQIDSTQAGKYVDELKVHFRGPGPFIPGRSYLSSFEVILLHTANDDLSDLKDLLPQDKEQHVVDFRGRGWVTVDLSEHNIQLPDQGYIIYGIKSVQGILHITGNSAEKNPGITPVMLQLSKWQQYGQPKIRAYRSKKYVHRMLLSVSGQF